MTGELVYNERGGFYEGDNTAGDRWLRVPLRAMAEARYLAIRRDEPLGILLQVSHWMNRPDLLALHSVTLEDIRPEYAETAAAASHEKC